VSQVIELRPRAATDDALMPADTQAVLATWRRRGVWAIVAWVGLFALWAVTAPISGSVVGSGVVRVEHNRQTVSHRDGGIVAEILVREGQTVRAGEALVALTDARVDSGVDLLEAQLAAENLRRSRLGAEVEARPTWAPPEGIATNARAATAVRVREALARERAAFEARRHALDGQLDSLRKQRADTDAEMQAHRRNIAAAQDALKLLREETASNEALLQENFVNRTRVLALKRGVADYESRIQTAEADLAQARQHRSELEGRGEALRLAYVQTAAEELRESSVRIVDFEERLRTGRDDAGRQVVTAPVAGRLVSLRVNTVGSAIGPREPIVDIVPSQEPLVFDTRVGSAAVAELAPGQKADIRLLGARQRQSALLPGRVTQVSADSLTDQRSGAPYFAVSVQVEPGDVEQAGLPTLKPGMVAEVYIQTRERTAIEFLLDPLLDGMRRAFREH
jgi:HlyD family type I secretion membrane fusion protein